MMKTILQGIGVVSTLVASIFGLMYILKGDIMISLVVSLVLVVIEFFLIEKFIKSKEEITKNRFSTLSVLLWSFYIILAIPLSIFLLHALNVEIYAKPNVQSVANKKIDDLSKMVSAFNTAKESSYQSFSVALSNELTKYAYDKSSAGKTILTGLPYKMSDEELSNLNRENIDQTVNSSIDARKMKLAPVMDSVEKRNKNFLKSYKKVFDNWAYFQINYAFYELDNLLKNNKEALLNGYKRNVVFPGAIEFDYSYTQEETNLDKPLALFSAYKPYPLFLAVLFFHFLILLPYFLTNTVGRYASPDPKGPRTGGGIEI